MKTPELVVMYSGGKGSWAAARSLLNAGADPVAMTLLFADTNGEDEDLYRFLDESAADLGAQLVRLDNAGQTIWDVFRRERMIGNTRLSVCSRALKQRPARAWLDANAEPGRTRVVVGIDWTESHRLPAVERSYAPFEVLAPLTWDGAWSKERVDKELASAGIEPPRLYAQGFPHNNCAGACVRAGQGQWALLLQHNPERYAREEIEENRFREELGKDVAILRDRSLRARLGLLGLTEADVETFVEPDDEWIEDGEHHTRPGASYLLHSSTQTVLEVPAVAPLPLTTLRHRIEDAQDVDMDDLGGCGCMADLDAETSL